MKSPPLVKNPSTVFAIPVVSAMIQAAIIYLEK
jgi:hypothetical protein